MWEHELTYKFTPSIEVEDIPKIEAFIAYLQTLISITREKEAKEIIEKELRSSLKLKKVRNKKLNKDKE
jgi:hypothetical protein